MLIEIRATDRLRGPRALDLVPVLNEVLRAAKEGTVDLSRLRVLCDWIQYKENFRAPVALRGMLPFAYEATDAGETDQDREPAGYELAIDLRRFDALDIAAEMRERLAGTEKREDGARVFLEPWGAGSASCIWEFNSLYWKALSLWEQVSGHEYEQALPGGESDARNTAGAHELIQHLFTIWDELADRRALPEELYILELGVGNGNQARVWLDEFVRLDRIHGRDYYRRLHYLMGDYSPHVLERARQNVRHHSEHQSAVVLDAVRPSHTLGFLRYKVFLAYVSNVYDNLPTDEIARLGGHLYHIQVRAYLPAAAAERIADRFRIALGDLANQIARLLRLGPELLAEATPGCFPAVIDAVEFWRALWTDLRLDERYIPLEELDTYEVVPGVSGEMLRPIVESNGDLRLHVSNGAAASFADTLPLLHPQGLLCCHDLFATDIHQYATGFRGPGKYDGSVVNWVNGPLLTAIGRRHGYGVRFAPFAYRTGSNVWTLTTYPLE